MRLVMAMRPEWTVTAMPIGMRVEVQPGLRFLIEPAQTVPLNTRVWGDRIVFGQLPRDRVAVRAVEDLTTGEGWPVTYTISDELGAAGTPVERRIHAIVRLAQYGIVVTARSTEVTALDHFEPTFRAGILAARADFSDAVCSISQIWDGLEMRDLVGPDPQSDQ
jgi:hypothetical protein